MASTFSYSLMKPLPSEFVTVFVALAASVTLSLTGCGSPTEGSPSPLPVLTSVSPDSVIAGVAQEITLTGGGFVPGSRGRVYGTNRPTTYMSETTLLVQLEEADVDDAIDLALSVANDPPGGGYSDPLAVRVVWETPTISDISPDTIVGGEDDVVLTVHGSGFRQGASFVFVGVDQFDATVLGPTELVTTLPGWMTDAPGDRPVRVYHYPTEWRPSQESNTLPLTILDAPPGLRR